MKMSESGEGPAFADMEILIKRTREFVARRRSKAKVLEKEMDIMQLSQKFGFIYKEKGKPEVILAEDAAIELGHPSTSSKSFVLLTFQAELVVQGRITIIGSDLDLLSRDNYHPFAQVVLLAVKKDEPPDPFTIDSTQYLTHRLPGYMVRSVPGRLWVRVSKKAREKGLTLETVGSALVHVYGRDFTSVMRTEILFVTSGKEDVDALSVMAAEAGILAGRHKKLALGMDGEVECAELNCETCEEKAVCDNLRDIVIKRRNRKR